MLQLRAGLGLDDPDISESLVPIRNTAAWLKSVVYLLMGLAVTRERISETQRLLCLIGIVNKSY